MQGTGHMPRTGRFLSMGSIFEKSEITSTGRWDEEFRDVDYCVSYLTTTDLLEYYAVCAVVRPPCNHERTEALLLLTLCVSMTWDPEV